MVLLNQNYTGYFVNKSLVCINKILKKYSAGQKIPHKVICELKTNEWTQKHVLRFKWKTILMLINISWYLPLVQCTAPCDEAWHEINPIYKSVADYPRFLELFLSS